MVQVGRFAIASAYYRGAVGALLVYDITRHVTFENVAKMNQRTQRPHRPKHRRPARGEQGGSPPPQSRPYGRIKWFCRKREHFFMETSVLEALNVENAFTEVLTQIYQVVCRKVLDIGDDPASVPRGQTINIGKDDVSAVKKGGCCSG